MTHLELRQKFFNFMEEKGHEVIPSSSLVPREDPTVLFNTAGMQPLVPYLMGFSQHPAGNRLANIQKCLRTNDIEEVGDNRHLTFFEMIGNWSIGDYFKKEAIEWSFEFLTGPNWLNLDPRRIFVTVYKGSREAAEDTQSAQIWREEFEKAGITADIGDEYDFKSGRLAQNGQKYIHRITKKSGKDNWWGLPHCGPCGSCTEIYYLSDDQSLDFETTVFPALSLLEIEEFVDNKIVEVWNNVFMEFEGEWGEDNEPKNLQPLAQKNVDTGLGFERILAFLNKKETVFETEVLQPLVAVVEKYRR